MALRIEILALGTYEIEWSKLVEFRAPGRNVSNRVQAYLILGGSEGAMLVDTGFRVLPGSRSEAGSDFLVRELARHGLRPSDVRYILHTHLHKGHCGQDDIFPDSTTVVMNRRELEFGCSGVDCDAYAAADMKHLVDRVHTPGAAWLLDLERGDPMPIVEGVHAQLCGGHTEGSMNILVETSDGTAVICGDLIFHVQDQLVETGHLHHHEPRISRATSVSQLNERAAVKRALANATWLLPMHDAPAKIERGGLVVGRVAGNSIPGPVTALQAVSTNRVG